MSHGPPPVPGGRSPEERDAARRERAARRVTRQRGESPGGALAGADGLPSAGATAAGRGADEAQARGGRRPRWGRIIAAVAGIAALAAAAWFLLSLFQPFHGDREGDGLRVRIPRGSTLGEIAQLLDRDRVIASAGFFELRARIEGRSGDLKPGSYRLRENMSYAAVLDRLERGVPPNVVVVTVPEGRSRREIAPLVRELEGDYMRATRRSPALDPRDYRAPGDRTLEGFLFPATYELKKGQPVSALVERQLEAFERNFESVDLSYARRTNLTPYEVLIIASMVEREAQVPRERRLVASVIYNRLRQGIPLGIDATIRFALNQWDEPLEQSELASPSPYNTRRNPGLPPGPIGNPGLASIEAAARPARTDYLFYVVKPGTCGEHAFSSTNAQFEEDVARYNAARERRGGRSPTDC
ncbi:MAG: endolytic transglycosylase MltG [Thermoleophilaceae bacterium]|nr:endolytic transglycosylase MltG [Thermoleophilaceae bacterium]